MHDKTIYIYWNNAYFYIIYRYVIHANVLHEKEISIYTYDIDMIYIYKMNTWSKTVNIINTYDIFVCVEVSIHGFTSKWMVHNGKSCSNWWFRGTPILENLHTYTSLSLSMYTYTWGILKWRIPEQWVSTLKWSKFGWFRGAPILGNLHMGYTHFN